MKIIAVNDEEPAIVRNDPLRVEVGESRILSNHALHSVDLDSSGQSFKNSEFHQKKNLEMFKKIFNIFWRFSQT